MDSTDNNPDVITISWHVDDVLGRGKESETPLTIEQARDILANIDRYHDATIGINWDVIDIHIDLYLADLDELSAQNTTKDTDG